MSRRLHITVDEATYQALTAAATIRGSRPTTIASAIITQAVTGAAAPIPTRPQLGAAIPRSHHLPATVSPPDIAEPAEQTPPGRTMWLQLDRGPAWRTKMWHAAQQLRIWYPDLNDTMREDWHTDRFTRDGIFALVVWRAQIDRGDQPDPRLEHQWLAALRDFKRMHDDHRRHVGSRAVTQDRPADW